MAWQSQLTGIDTLIQLYKVGEIEHWAHVYVLNGDPSLLVLLTWQRGYSGCQGKIGFLVKRSYVSSLIDGTSLVYHLFTIVLFSKCLQVHTVSFLHYL